MEDLKRRFQKLSAFGKIIAINVIIFVSGILVTAIFKYDIYTYFRLPADASEALLRFWSIISYSFIHSGVWHLIFNMLLLFYLSEVLINLLPIKKVLNIYFLGRGGLFSPLE